MGQIYKADFQVDNGTDFDKYNFSTTADQVSYTKNGKETNVQAELDAVNTGIDTFNWRNGHDYTSNWSGTISIAANSVTKFSKIFGKITHKSATAPTWGETVCKITYTGNSVPLMVYSNRGQVYNAFVLSGTGEIKVYGSDKQYMVHSGEEFTFCTYIT